MIPQLDSLDDEALAELENREESLTFERKASDWFHAPQNRTAIRNAIAKAACAFANAEGGLLAFGLLKEGGFDGGVPRLIGKQETALWAEQVITSAVQREINGCEARLVHLDKVHQGDSGLLLIRVPSSNGRPHWIADGQIPYLRVGARSEPMSLQTFRDIGSRGMGTEVRLTRLSTLNHHSKLFSVCPVIELVSGSICREWRIELRLSERNSFFFTFNPIHNITKYDSDYAVIEGDRPLFPGQPIPASRAYVRVTNDDAIVVEDQWLEVAIAAEGAASVASRFALRDLLKSATADPDEERVIILEE